jgi:hypothetical protein
MVGKCKENGVAEQSPNGTYQHWMRRRSIKKKIRISVVFNMTAHW